MGERGPVPKRSEERIRRNTTEYGPIDNVTAIGTVSVPDLGLEDPHPLVSDLWASLHDSAQSRFYEPSDWQYARIVCHFLDGQLKAPRPNSQMVANLSSMMGDLLVSEGDRRRVRMEVDRKGSSEEPKAATVSQLFKERLSS